MRLAGEEPWNEARELDKLHKPKEETSEDEDQRLFDFGKQDLMDFLLFLSDELGGHYSLSCTSLKGNKTSDCSTVMQKVCFLLCLHRQEDVP